MPLMVRDGVQPEPLKRAPQEAAMGQRPGTALLLLLTLGYLLKSLAAETRCENIYQDFSNCILKLGENMASYEKEEEEEEEKSQEQALHTICGYWDEFHACAMTALWECQGEAATIWEMLKKESRKITFQGSLFDLCASSDSRNFSSTQFPTISLLSFTLMVTWLNL